MESAPRGFQFSLLSELSKTLKDKNIVISPISIYLALALTAHGADGKTLDEMLQVLLKNKPLAELTKSAAQMMETLNSGNVVKVANAVMTKVKPTEEFVQSCKAFDAMVDKLVSAEQVNTWCSEKTNGKIPKILDSIDNMEMIILNAVYFLGKWKVSFDKNLICQIPFTNSKSEKKTVPFLCGELKNTMYYEDEEFKMVQLYYTQNDLSAFILLPKSMPEFLANVNQNKVHVAMGQTEEKTVKLSFPKFKIEFSTQLEQILPALGIKEAFTNCADFSKITKEVPLHISEVIHKTFINVDEEGTEAAAVTAVKMSRMCMRPMNDGPVIMHVDKPFLFMINSTNICDHFLFTTLVNDI